MRSGASRVLLIVDFRNQVYRAASAHAALFSGRTFTGGLYGFLVSVCKAIREVEATQVVVATDTRPYVRNSYFKGYKADRGSSKVDETQVMKASQSMRLVQEFCEKAVKVPVWSVKGFEFDDIAAWATRALASRYDRIVVMSNDSDLYQLFDVLQFAIFKGGDKGVYTLEDFREEYKGITTEDLITLLAMSGTHNAVPGINGIGPVKALKAVLEPDKHKALYQQHSRLIDRNRDLIRLPHDDFPRRPDLRVQRHTFSMRDIQLFCARYEIRLTQGIVEALAAIRHE